ncbi:DUF6090 family protein [Flavobacterium sp.]|uniref:DUF6090 family protein n=1 Tax=Flavobacterium sp. TaxID=239 RepID=UPI0025C4D2A2|nr:DUF6090 family protein [Flavobacterium sp.]
MEEELRKHLNKVAATEMYQGKNFVEKIKHFVSEVIIIVFAVTLSISLHSWSENRHHQNEVEEFLTDLKEDLKEERISQVKHIDNVSTATEMFVELLKIDKKFIDGIDKSGDDVVFVLNFLTHQFDSGNYEGFKSSGKIGFIKNREIKKLILRFYEQRVPLTIEVENRYNNQIRVLNDYATTARDKKEMFLTRRSKVMFDLARQAGLQCDTVYKENIALIDSIIKELKNQ